VLAAAPTSRVYAGLLPGVDETRLRFALAAGTVGDCLHQFQPRPGDCVYLPAGTVHAVGGGVLMAEVQQTSDATFRLFDWNRLGQDGKPRTLHVEQALAAIDWDRGPVQTLNGAPIAGCPSGECLVQCPYFNMDRYFFDQQLPNPYSGRLSIWIVFAGSALLATSGNYRRSFRAGETVLIPASAPASSWKTANGPVTLLGVSLPS